MRPEKNMNGFVVNLQPLSATEDQFCELVKLNPELRLERTSTGEVIVMPPAGSETGARNSRLTMQLGIWNAQTQLGIAFDSSSGFTLPNGAIRAPDASWIAAERWRRLTREQRRRFAPIAPDFVIELVSPSDEIDDVRDKMRDYMVNGVQLGWLIDPQERRIEVYRPGTATQILDNPISVSADPELPGFVLDLQEIFADI
jgi:Uma2 family endonuclease